MLKKIVKGLLYRPYTLVVIERELDAPVRSYKTSKRWEIRQMIEADLPRCQTYLSHQMVFFSELFKTNCKGFVAVEHSTGDIIAVAWFAPEDFYDSYHRYTFKVNSHEVFQFAGEVAEPFRKTPLAVQVQNMAWKYWSAQGKKMLTSNIESDNSASFRMAFHVGWRETGTLICLQRWLGLQFSRVVHYEGERFSKYQKKRKKISDNLEEVSST